VNRWAGEVRKLRNEDRDVAAEIQALDPAMSKMAIERLDEMRATNQESEESFSWH
jgi:hypothetical protein